MPIRSLANTSVVVLALLFMQSNCFGQTNRLVAAYGFDEGSGNTTADVSENGNIGVIAGATWTTAGKSSNALVFNGLDSMVTANDSASLDLSGSMTLEAWVYPTVTSDTYSTIGMKVSSESLVYGLSTNPGDYPACAISIDNVGVLQVVGDLPLPLNEWTHLASTFDGAFLRLYTNGVEVATTIAFGNITVSTGPLCIGGNIVWGEFFAGRIDELSVYNRALSQTEIQSDMVNPAGVGLPPDTEPPTVPQNPTAIASSASQIDLAWHAATDNVEVKDYRVERQDPGSTNFIQITNLVGTAFSDTSLISGKTYAYRVRATDAAGNPSPYSTVVSATTWGIGMPGFAGESHVAKDGLGVDFDGATVSIDVKGADTMLLVVWHSEFDDFSPDSWRVECNGVPGTSITDTNGYSGEDGNRRFRTYYWLNPSPGQSTIFVTNDFATSDNELAVSAVLLTNVQQTSPIRGVALDVSMSERTAESETVATTTDDLVVHIIADALVSRGTLGPDEISRSVANDGKHLPLGDASLWISTKPGAASSTTVSSTEWASRVINGVAIAVHGVRPISLASISIGDPLAHITGVGDAGATYKIQSSSNLVEWADLATVVANTNGLFEYQDSAAANVTARFYRTTQP